MLPFLANKDEYIGIPSPNETFQIEISIAHPYEYRSQYANYNPKTQRRRNNMSRMNLSRYIGRATIFS